jgi:hypothetical protein
MNPHNHEQNPSLDEIESAAPVAASFWLHEALCACNDEGLGTKDYPAGIAGSMIACALYYQAERQVDAAHEIAEALREATATVKRATAILDAMLGPRFKGKPERFEG